MFIFNGGQRIGKLGGKRGLGLGLGVLLGQLYRDRQLILRTPSNVSLQVFSCLCFLLSVYVSNLFTRPLAPSSAWIGIRVAHRGGETAMSFVLWGVADEWMDEWKVAAATAIYPYMYVGSRR
jgi:hypothetical protein